jgi:glycoside hydrolase-like protein
MQGLDFAWSKPSVAAIKAGGYGFVCRYHSYDTTGKNLTKAEADSYLAAGIQIVSNWEYATDAALNGFNQGVADATEGAKQQAACGGPIAPIIFSVDFDATEAQQAAINSYLQGCASVIGLARTGVYGGYYIVKRCFDAGVITYGWQTYAWSGGQWDPRAQLRQVQNGITVGGADCDLNTSMAANFGQWNSLQWNEDDDVPAIIIHDPAGSIVLAWPTEDGIVWQDISHPATEAAWVAATGAPVAELPASVAGIYTEVHAAVQARTERYTAAMTKALEDAGAGTGGGGGGGSTTVPDHQHTIESSSTGSVVPPTP